jgi:hypothetical protein
MNEQRLREQLGDMMLRAMNNKAEILAELMTNMESLGVMSRGLSNFEEVCKKVEDGETEALSPVATAQMIRVLSKTCRVQAKVILHLSCFAMIYGNGDSYDGDASRAAMRFGKGNEALQAMIRSKFGGRNPFSGG